MKKMILTLAVFFTAVVTNAGYINWNSGVLSYLTTGDGSDYATSWQGQTMYFFITSGLDYDTSTLVDSLKAGGSFNSSGADASKKLAGNPAFGTGAAMGSTLFTDGDYAYGYGIVFNADGTKFAIANVSKSMVFAAGSNATLTLGGTTKDSLGKYAVYDIVPEPTSMALLALGAAAVGLRRRFRK